MEDGVGSRARLRRLLSKRALIGPLAGVMLALAACTSGTSPTVAAPLASEVPSSVETTPVVVVAHGPATFDVTVLVTGACRDSCREDSGTNTVTATDCGSPSPRGSAFARYGQEVTVTDVETGGVGRGTLKSFDSPPVTVTDPPRATCRFHTKVKVPVGRERPGIRTVRVALGPSSVGLLTARVEAGTTNYAVVVNV